MRAMRYKNSNKLLSSQKNLMIGKYSSNRIYSQTLCIVVNINNIIIWEEMFISCMRKNNFLETFGHSDLFSYNQEHLGNQMKKETNDFKLV